MIRNETFGQILNRHIMTADFLDEQLSDGLRDHLISYIKLFKVSFFTLHFHTTVDGEDALSTDDKYLINGVKKTTRTLKVANGEAADQVSFVYMMKKPYWIISAKSDEDLSQAESYKDLWDSNGSNVLNKIPKYIKNTIHEEIETKTSIIIPIIPQDSQDKGVVVNFEFEKVVQPTEIIKEELKRIANIAYSIRSNFLGSKKERESTVHAFEIISQTNSFHDRSNTILATLLAVDLINNEIYNRAKRQIEKLIDDLGVVFYIFHQPIEVEKDCSNQLGYTPSEKWCKNWSNAREQWHGNTNLVYDDEKKPKTQVAYVFHSKSTAVITGDAETLGASKKFEDAKNPSAAIPGYINNSSRNTRTSIICPSLANNEDKIFGVVNYEFEDAPSEEDLETIVNSLLNLSRAIGRLEYLQSKYQKKEQTSRSYLNELHPFLDSRLQFKLQVFFAYPKNNSGSGTVVQIINCIIEELNESNNNRIEMLPWEATKRTGGAQKNLRDDIKNSHFVIGYISEKDEEKNKYKDNVNVMLELAAAYFEDESKALGVRESDSLRDLPFNISDIQMVKIERGKGSDPFEKNKFNQEFIDIFTSALDLNKPG